LGGGVFSGHGVYASLKRKAQSRLTSVKRSESDNERSWCGDVRPRPQPLQRLQWGWLMLRERHLPGIVIIIIIVVWSRQLRTLTAHWRL